MYLYDIINRQIKERDDKNVKYLARYFPKKN